MSVIPERKDYKKILPEQAAAFVRSLPALGYELASHVKATEKSHFDRYGLVKKNKRVVIVYDIKAQMLSVTAFDQFIGELCSAFDKVRTAPPGSVSEQHAAESRASERKPENKPADRKTEKKAQLDRMPNAKNTGGESKLSKAEQAKPAQKAKNSDAKSVNVSKQSPVKDKTVAKLKPASGQKPQDKPASQKGAAQKIQSKPTRGGEINAAKQQAPKLNVATDGAQDSVIKSDFTLKKYGKERFESVLESLKQGKIKVRQKQSKGAKSEQIILRELAEGTNKLTVCYLADKQILQIQGKPDDFMRKVQTIFSESMDFKSAVNAHIEQKQTQKKASDVERLLKKYLPTGVLYLSSQAKIDFSIGIIDLLTGETELSDYSSLLIPPYRGLEMLIFDLQKAQGIKVKMIGQAFEKTPAGEYTLKASYRKKINSIVFNEVMVALYGEYNSTRNFYVHSSLGGSNKVISDKNQAKSIYERMLSVVEYNAKKLKEIHFSI